MILSYNLTQSSTKCIYCVSPSARNNQNTPVYILKMKQNAWGVKHLARSLTRPVSLMNDVNSNMGLIETRDERSFVWSRSAISLATANIFERYMHKLSMRVHTKEVYIHNSYRTEQEEDWRAMQFCIMVIWL